MNPFDPVRACERQNVVVSLELLRNVEKALAAKILLGKLQTLDHRPESAIENKDALGGFFAKSPIRIGKGQFHRA